MEIKSEDLMTVRKVAEELKVSDPAVRTMLDTVEPTLTVGRVRLYHRDAVKAALRVRHESVLNFLGVRPESESYDNVISTDAPASDDQE